MQNKQIPSGSTAMLLLKLLSEQDMYGYQITETLARRSDQTFSLKAGTLYPLLHQLETQGLVTAYEKTADSGRVRKYYQITDSGRRSLEDKQAQWTAYRRAVDHVLRGGEHHAEA